jgi:hypothetical protein
MIEHIALPYAIKQLFRAIKSILRLHKELMRVTVSKTHSSEALSVYRLADRDRRSRSIHTKDQWTEQTSQLKPLCEEVTDTLLPLLSLPL